MKTCPKCSMRYPNEAKVCFLDGENLSNIGDMRLGQSLGGRYVLEQVIGEGGMATVYLASQKHSSRKVAVKLMNQQLAEDKVTLERFRREARSAQKLAHPNIIAIFEQGETEEGCPYIVMEYLEGEILSSIVGRGAVPLSRALAIMIQCARGIARAHDFEVIHRDLKPENIFICSMKDETEVVKLLDFGIARSLADARLTTQGELFGTPQYMSPERISGRDASAADDIYSLGVVFFEIATGHLPFQANDIATFFIKHLSEAPRSPLAINPMLPVPLANLILQMLAKDPKDRPIDAHRIHAELMALAADETFSTPPETLVELEDAESLAMANPQEGGLGWTQRVEAFSQLLITAFGAPAAVPQSVSGDLAEAREIALRMHSYKQGILKSEKELREAEQRYFEARNRFGTAMSNLGGDASRARDEHRSADHAVKLLEKHVEEARAAFVAHHSVIAEWEARASFATPLAELSDAYSAAAELVDSWRESRTALEEARAKLLAASYSVNDLDFQVTALRNASDQKAALFEGERTKLLEGSRSLNEQLNQAERKLREIYATIEEPLRGRAEFADFFAQLERLSEEHRSSVAAGGLKAVGALS